MKVVSLLVSFFASFGSERIAIFGFLPRWKWVLALVFSMHIHRLFANVKVALVAGHTQEQPAGFCSCPIA